MRTFWTTIAALLVCSSCLAATVTVYVTFPSTMTALPVNGAANSVGYTWLSSTNTIVGSRITSGTFQFVDPSSAGTSTYGATITWPAPTGAVALEWDSGTAPYTTALLTLSQIEAVDVNGAVTFNNTTIGTVTNVTNAVTVTGTPAVNVTQVAGQTASAASAVTFPSTISSYSGGAITGITGVTFPLTVPALSAITAALPTDTSIPTDILGATASSWNSAGTIGAKINAAGTASDPWSTLVPGAYGAGTAGNILGNNLNATVSSRSTYSGGAVASVTGAVGSVTNPVTVGTNNDKTSYTLTVTPPTAAQNASALMNYSVGHALTFGQLMVLLQAAPGLVSAVTNTWNGSTHVLTTAYQFSGDGAAVLTTSTQYPTSQVTNPAITGRTTSTGTIPQP